MPARPPAVRASFAMPPAGAGAEASPTRRSSPAITGGGQADIARALGLSHSSVKGVVQTARMREAGRDPSVGRPRPLPREEILARYHRGERAAEIARALCSPT